MQDYVRTDNREYADFGSDEISLLQLFQMMMRNIKMIVALALVGAVLAYGITAFCITPMYESEVKLYVNNAKMLSNEMISSADIAASKSLVETYIAMMGSNTVIESVIAKARLPYTVEEITKMMTADSVSETEIFYVRIENPDPAVAKRIADAFATTAMEKISEYVEGSAVRIIDTADLAEEPFSPSPLKNTAIGFLAGLLLGALIAFIKEMLDTRVKSEEDLRRVAGYPIIGRIPDLNAVLNGKKAGYSYGYSNDEGGGGK